MIPPLFLDSVLLGVQHSFEPDHMAAITVLASEKSSNTIRLKKLIWRSSQWALGHSVTLILFSLLALLIKSLLPIYISGYAEMIVGPVMVWLGISAIQRNYQLKKIMEVYKKADGSKDAHTHGSNSEHIALNPLNKSFWVGMLHGLAGTGGACATALILASDNTNIALGIIVLQSLGIIITMTSYGCILAFSVSRYVERNIAAFKLVNTFVGIFSIIVGLVWIYESLTVLLGN